MRWDSRFRPLAVLFGAALILATPLLGSLARAEFLRQWITGLGHLMEVHRFRELTGYAAFGLILFELLLTLRKRTGFPFPGSFPGWRTIHMLTGVALLVAVVIHTGGRWGVNLNGWLLSALLLTAFVGLSGKLLEAHLIERLTRTGGKATLPMRRLVASATEPIRRASAFIGVGLFRVATWRSDVAIKIPGVTHLSSSQPPARQPRRQTPLVPLRMAWLQAHVLLVAALMVLLGFHILSVYYF